LVDGAIDCADRQPGDPQLPAGAAQGGTIGYCYIFCYA
jgi:hypothetical protein